MSTADELVGRLSDAYLTRNGVPSQEQSDDRRRALDRIVAVMDGVLVRDGVRCSPLGVEWTDVFAAHVRELPEADLLESRGWVRLDGFFATLEPRPDQAWGVIEHHRLLAAVTVGRRTPDSPVSVVLSRARWQGEVRLREMLELRTLYEAGTTFPVSSEILQIAADLENGLDERVLVRWTSGRRISGPAPVRERARRGSMDKLVIACSGVDGAGKTTLMDRLCKDLAAAGILVTRVWLRPGMGLGWLSSLATRLKKIIGQSAETGFSVIAADGQARLRSRRGSLGWTWSLLITLSYLHGVRRQHAAARGVVAYDRHILDALATMRVLYAGSDTRFHQWLIRKLTPAADVILYLDVPLDVAVARKPGDVVGRSAVERQLAAYGHLLPTTAAVVLDATRPVDELAHRAFTHVATAAGR